MYTYTTTGLKSIQPLFLFKMCTDNQCIDYEPQGFNKVALQRIFSRFSLLKFNPFLLRMVVAVAVAAAAH